MIAMLHEHHFRAMNTDVGVWVWSADPTRSAIVRTAIGGAEDYFVRVEAELSRFRGTSALSRVNRAAGRGPQIVSRMLWTVLQAALDAAEESGGVYDPTMLHSLERIGYDRSFENVAPIDPADVGSLEGTFGSWRRVRLDRATRSVSLPADLALDLGGIAKGWTVDHVALALEPLGPTLVDAGGDLRVVGAVNDEPWPIAVQDSFNPERDRGLVRLHHGALATSSIGGRCWQRGGRMLHHVLDPRTGMSAGSDLHSVTVRAKSALIADVAAKVVLVLGSGAGTGYLLQRGLAALLTSTDGRESVVGDFPCEEVKHRDSSYCA